MRYLSLSEILELHERIISSSGGSHGIHDIKTLESSINQPRQTFNQNNLYPDTVSKAAALCFFLVKNHPFIDGNKRQGKKVGLKKSDILAAVLLHPPQSIESRHGETAVYAQLEQLPGLCIWEKQAAMA